MSTSIVKMIARPPQRSPLQTGIVVAQALGAQTGRLNVIPDQLRQLALDFIGVIVGIGVPRRAGPPLVIMVDRSAPALTRRLVQALEVVPEVESASGVTAQGQQVLLRKFRPMMTLYSSAVQTGAVLDDCRTVMGAVQRKFWLQIKDAVFGARAKNLFSKQEQDLMEAALNQLIAEDDKAKQAPVDRRARTRRSNLRHEANVAAMGDHTELLKTMIDLQSGAPVADDRVAAAEQIYEKLNQDPSAARPTPKKSGPTLH